MANTSTQNLKDHVLFLSEKGSRFRHQEGELTYHHSIWESKITYLTDIIKSYGYEITEENFNPDITIQNQKIMGKNLVFEIKGTELSEEVIELGAHYDTKYDSFGADDNCSAVAALLETARLMASQTCKRTVRFILFDLEEWIVMGSEYHVNLVKASSQKFKGIIVLEMIGFTSQEPESQKTPIRIPFIFDPPRVADFVAIVGNHQSAWIGNLLEKCLAIYTPTQKVLSLNRLGGYLKDSTRSDHRHYWINKLPGIMMTDTSFLRNPHYHLDSDKADTLDYEFLTNNTKAVCAAMLHWANS